MREGARGARRAAPPVIAALVAALMLVLFVGGMTFANSVGAARVASNAASLHWANSVSGTASLTRAALAQAITFVSLEERGLATPDDVDFAMAQVDEALAELETLVSDPADALLRNEVAEFLGRAERVRSALVASGSDDATGAMAFLEESFVGLSVSLANEQDRVQEAIVANTEAAARVDGLLTYIFTLAVPSAAVLVYWRIARRQVREHRERARIELEAERSLNRAKDSFIAGLSHELRTPLTSVYGFAEVLAEGEVEDPRQVRELAREIAAEAAELARMVDDLIVASRFESTGVAVEPGPTELTPVVESALHRFRRAGVPVEWSPCRLEVWTDAARLSQVLVNLVSNAVRHGGPRVGLSASEVGGRVEIEVWDDGPGVPEDMLDRLYQRFTHDGSQSLLTGSVGLGLAVAARLLEQLDGSIRYRRAEGRTSFMVEIPLHRSDVIPSFDRVSPRPRSPVRAR